MHQRGPRKRGGPPQHPSKTRGCHRFTRSGKRRIRGGTHRGGESLLTPWDFDKGVCTADQSRAACQWLVQAGSADVSEAFASSRCCKTPAPGPLTARLGTSPSRFTSTPVPPAAPRELLPTKHIPAPFWGHETHLHFGLCREGGSRRRPAVSLMPLRDESLAIVISVIHPAMGADSHTRSCSESAQAAAAGTSSFHTLPPPACPFPLPACHG